MFKRRSAFPGDDVLQPIYMRALVISFDPVVDEGRGTRLTQAMKWRRVEDLTEGYIADVRECSGGLVRYEVVDQLTADKFPVKEDGFSYTAKSYMDLMAHRARPHDPDWVDYHRILDQFNLGERVERGEIDEVWMFGFPSSGFYESRMVGRGAFWCNAPQLEGTDQIRRRFVMMGFSYERGVGEMLEDLGHRAESVMSKVFERVSPEKNPWKRFTLYDKVAPGRAEIGSVHYAPNSDRDYDWGNPRVVLSRCDNWLHYPDLSGEPHEVTCSDWGGGDIRLHHIWWLSHIPKVHGLTGGISNNWWNYFIRVDHPIFG